MSGRLRFNVMHFMPYIYLPENHKDYKSLWVDFSNKNYDPEKGHELYNRYLSELVLADKLGYDAVVVNEHHNTVYSMMATPSVLAAALIPQTKNVRICVWGVPPNFMLPNRLAEEYAILDVMSKGRLEIAFPLGTGMEYWAHPISPALARDKFKESLKIMLQAWREDGPTTHYGKFYTYRFLNPWPRPYQKRGEEDRIIPVQQLETWKKYLPNAKTQTFKGGHIIQLESPEAVEAIAKFLA